MLKYTKFYYILFVFLLISCFNSENKKDKKVLTSSVKMNIKKIFDITPDSSVSFSYIPSIAVDDDCNIYILDNPNSKILKFDRDGKFVKLFGNNGKGPGEFSGCFEIFYYLGFIYAVDTGSSRIVKYNENGEFISNISIAGDIFPMLIKPLNGNKFIATTENVYNENGKKIKEYSVVILDKNFKVLQIITKNKAEFNKWNYLNSFIPYTVSDENIYISNNSTTQYSFSKYNLNGKFEKAINKPYRKLSFTDLETKDLDLYLKKITGKGSEKGKIFKNAINGVYSDNKQNIWVLYSQDRNKVKDFIQIDVFDRNGNLLGNTELSPIRFSGDYFNLDKLICHIKDNRIYYLDAEKNVITVYKYDY